MITRVTEEQYLNIFERIWLLLAAEFLIAMNFIRVFDMETEEWRPRRVFWYVIGIMSLLALVYGNSILTVALLKLGDAL